MRRVSTPCPTSPASFQAAVDAGPISFLTGMDAATFWETHWEKSSRLFEATPARTAWVATLPTTASLVGRRGLRWGLDVVACRCVGGTRSDLNPAGSWGAPIDPADLARLMGGGEAATLQVHHPQRFDAEAWRVVAALERDLGCLVGTNSYLTPPGGARGLAPHWDDVDVWVVQVEGRKHWTVYERRGENTDAVAPSGDLARGSRFVSGRVELEAVLSPGDVLYIPRGTVHQARTEGCLPSNHLTISSFQRWSAADLACAAVRAAAGGDPAGLPNSVSWRDTLDPARASLGPGAIYRAGFGVAALPPARRPAPDAVSRCGPKDVAHLLRTVARDLESSHGSRTPGLFFDTAWDVLAADFFASRLPPFPSQVAPASGAPTLGCFIACRAPRCFRLACKMDMDTLATCVSVLSCLANSRAGHMCGGGVGVGVGGGSDSDEDEDEEEDDDDEEEESTSDEDDSSDEEGDNDRATAFASGARCHLAAALAATRAAPLEVVTDDDGSASDVVTTLPHSLAMALWDQGVVYVV